MAFLAFQSQKPEVVGPKVAEALQHELEAPNTPAFQVEAGDAGPTTLKVFLKEAMGATASEAMVLAVGSGLAKMLGAGRKEAILFSLHFGLPAARPTHLVVHVARQGIGSHVSGLFYSTPLAKPVAGEVTLEKDGKFAGHAALAEKLNANKLLRKRCEAFARTSANMGGVDITLPRHFRISPCDAGSVLEAATLPLAKMLGFKVLLDAKEYLELVAALEAAL
jgi:hypothetical protein